MNLSPVFLINPQMEDKAACYSSLVAALSEGADRVVQSSNKEQQWEGRRSLRKKDPEIPEFASELTM